LVTTGARWKNLDISVWNGSVIRKRPAGSGGRDQEWTPDGGLVPSIARVKMTAGDAKEGGSDGFAPDENAARVHKAARGAMVGLGDGHDPAVGRLPGGVCRDDVALGPVYA
jgi:hypothetical protein